MLGSRVMRSVAASEDVFTRKDKAKEPRIARINTDRKEENGRRSFLDRSLSPSLNPFFGIRIKTTTKIRTKSDWKTENKWTEITQLAEKHLT